MPKSNWGKEYQKKRLWRDFGMTASGAGLGAILGTFVFPGIGTAIGAGIGAAAGLCLSNIAQIAIVLYKRHEGLRASEDLEIRRSKINQGAISELRVPSIISGAGIGAGIGAVIGTFVFPGIGTAMGAFFGALIGLVGGGLPIVILTLVGKIKDAVDPTHDSEASGDEKQYSSSRMKAALQTKADVRSGDDLAASEASKKMPALLHSESSPSAGPSRKAESCSSSYYDNSVSSDTPSGGSRSQPY
jgi:hypothetical protein